MCWNKFLTGAAADPPRLLLHLQRPGLPPLELDVEGLRRDGEEPDGLEACHRCPRYLCHRYQHGRISLSLSLLALAWSLLCLLSIDRGTALSHFHWVLAVFRSSGSTVPKRGIRKGGFGTNKNMLKWLTGNLNVTFRWFDGRIPLFGSPFGGWW